MLVALLSICAETEGGDGSARGLLRFAGQSVAERQIQQALRLGAERIVCLVDGIDSEVIDLQEIAREGGAKFNAVSGGLSLLGQVSAGDEIVVFGDGVLPEASAVEARLGEKPGVLVIPAEGAVEEGYERIDGEWAWAGVMRASGATVEGLSQLPPDSDPVSALLRLALQRGTRVIPIDGAKAMRAGWLLAKNEAQVAGYEREFLRRHANRSGLAQPFRATADLVAFRLAGPALDRGLGGTPAFLFAAVCALGAIVSGAEGLPILGLGLLALGSFLADIGRSLSRMLNAIRQETKSKEWLGMVSSILFDLSFVTLAAISAADPPRVEYGVLALLLVGLLRLAAQSSKSRVLAPLRDRTMIFALLTVAASLAVLKPVMAITCLAIVAVLLFVQRETRITPA